MIVSCTWAAGPDRSLVINRTNSPRAVPLHRGSARVSATRLSPLDSYRSAAPPPCQFSRALQTSNAANPTASQGQSTPPPPIQGRSGHS